MCESHAAIIKLKFLRYCSLPVLTDKKSVPLARYHQKTDRKSK